MAKSREDWASLSGEERRELVRADKQLALDKIEAVGFPHAVEITVAGRKFRLEPTRVTDAGGITYSLPMGSASVEAGDYRVRPNKASFTLSLASDSMSIPDGARIL